MSAIRSFHLPVTRTARYFMLGEQSDATQEIVFAIHGYAQLASDFLEQLSFLEDPSRVIIAPEGLSRFYAKGFGGKPAASWMTSEDREEEIKDYVEYLGSLYKKVVPGGFPGRVTVLGFSQGVAAASRWIHHTSERFTRFIIHSGEIGAELREPLSGRLKAIPVIYITGTEDPLISPGKQQEVNDVMNALNAEMISFKGGHTVNAEAVKQAMGIRL